MIPSSEGPNRSKPRWLSSLLWPRLDGGRDRTGGDGRWIRPDGAKSHILVIEDERAIRESLGGLLEEEGYQVSFADNGQEGLRKLHTQSLPDVIVLDLRMPVMDGWEFRAVQKDDPKLGRIPVVAISADGSAQAVTISAQAYLRKPLDVSRLLRTIEGVLFENERRLMSERLEEAERLASLGRLAAGVGHEINNPLTFTILNVNRSLDKLRTSIRASSEADELGTSLRGITEMLEDCQVGLARIRDTVGNLQRLSRKQYEDRGRLDIHELIDQSVSMVWNQIRHRARLARAFGEIPPINGNATALGQVFLNLLVNAAQAIPEGDAEQNEIRITTKMSGGQVVVEISDTGKGIAPEVVSHLFEPFFTTKPMGFGTGLGLSISRQTVVDCGGRIEVESELGKGSVFRVLLPLGADVPLVAPRPDLTIDTQTASFRGRVLVVDDEPLIGRVIRAALSHEHDVIVVQQASDALGLLAKGETFDLVLCDVVMPDISGPDVYVLIAEKWPRLVSRLVFMTGGAFTPRTMDFIERTRPPVISKPFDLGQLTDLVRKYVREYR